MEATPGKATFLKGVCLAQGLGSLDHGLFYIHPEQAVHLEFFRAGPERPISLEFLRKQYREPATLAACVARLRMMGVRAAAVDITPSALPWQGFGWSVRSGPTYSRSILALAMNA